MGTLPPGYLRWLIREGHDPSLAVWADYAKQVLQDPYYRDRVEWQKIEKLSSKGEVPKREPSGIGASAKESMIALGWDLSDRNAWSKVNFSLLGTTAGGRIPRKDPPSPSSIPKASVAKRKTAVSRPSMEPNTYTFPSRLKLLGKSLDLSASYEKHSNTNAAENSRTIPSNLGASESESESEPTKSLSLREELLRRRQLRRERSASKSSIVQPPTSGSAQHRFPGRDSLMQRARKRVDT
ncbi:hypothetical protein KP509_16G048000 [Ceratopteris richardii]|nr:hypothetical protein KP509_16G048000 [Ceratopteris richardii]